MVERTRQGHDLSGAYDSLEIVWTADYSTGARDSWNWASAMAVDGSGNVYVTGISRASGTFDDYATVKYNSAGVEQWVARYNGSGDYIDWPYAIALDRQGNVYVTGWSWPTGFTHEYATLKYDSNGVEQWLATYGGPGAANEARDVVVDDSGNVYVTGRSLYSTSTYYDFATVKYNSSGDEQWVGRYSGQGYTQDNAYAIALDSSGNVYVTGVSQASQGSTQDYVTVKYDASGVEQWVARRVDPTHTFEYGWAIAVRDSDNIYVTGWSFRPGTDRDYVTVKYNSLGIEQWVARYSGPGNGADYVTDMILDRFGNIYVTGRSRDVGGDYDFATVKYNASGVELWVARYDGPGNANDVAYALALDDSDNLYVTGSSWSPGSDYDYATVKYNASGVEQSVALYNAPGSGWDEARGIGIDNSNNVYVAGSTTIANGLQYTTIKYRQVLTGIPPKVEQPKAFLLRQNYPNPFNPATIIHYSIPFYTHVKLTVYSLLGQEVATLVDDELEPGNYEANWNAAGFPSGIYLYRLQTNDFVETRKLILLR